MICHCFAGILCRKGHFTQVWDMSALRCTHTLKPMSCWLIWDQIWLPNPSRTQSDRQLFEKKQVIFNENLAPRLAEKINLPFQTKNIQIVARMILCASSNFQNQLIFAYFYLFLHNLFILAIQSKDWTKGYLCCNLNPAHKEANSFTKKQTVVVLDANSILSHSTANHQGSHI